MKRENCNRDWYFTKGSANLMGLGKRVQLPHDYMIEGEAKEDAPAGASMGYFTESPAAYTKYLDVPGEWEGERVYLHFDGVMMNAAISVNGSLVERHHYGYTPFSVDITDALYFGKRNRITVAVNPSMQPNSRWYSGAGIYRNVELSHVKPLHIEPEGIYAYTKRIDFQEKDAEAGESALKDSAAKMAQLMVEVTLRNQLAEDHQVRVRALLLPQSGVEEGGNARAEAPGKEESAAGSEPHGAKSLAAREESGQDITRAGSLADRAAVSVRDTVVLVKAGSTAVARIPMTVERPLLWDAEHPHLYCIKAELEDMGAFGVAVKEGTALEGICDEAQTTFGIRMISADSTNGLLVNGRPTKLKGGCIHHDNGILGAVSLGDSERRKISRLKAAGFNAVRLAHNPGSRELLEACDSIGIYVFEEAFDAWGISKQPGDYSQFFAEDWKKDMEAFILRDRNHPCVLFWSTGNEVEERGGIGNGYAVAEELAAFIRGLDSTRLVSNGVCSCGAGWGLDDQTGLRRMQQQMAQTPQEQQSENAGRQDVFWEDRIEAFCNCLDVVGYNYMDDNYEYVGRRYPERVILGTESFPQKIDIVWDLVERLPYVIGDCTWTAVDYLGEAGIGKSIFYSADGQAHGGAPSHVSDYPWRLANDADITVSGKITPQGTYRKIVWGSHETGLYAQHPKYHGMEESVSAWGWKQMTDCWNYEGYEGKPVRIYVYSAADEVELWLNGKSCGRAAAGKENRYTAVFEVNYEPGSLSAASFLQGVEISRAEIATTDRPASIRLRPDRAELRADGQSLSYVEVEIVDAAGKVVKDADLELEASLEVTEIPRDSWNPFRGVLTDQEMKALGEKVSDHSREEAADCCAWLAAFGSDNPITEDNYTAGRCHAFQGSALAVVRAGYIAGKAVLKVSAPGLGEACAEIQVQA